ncbi:hypothetical protein E2C01_033120 [Portunus trituberculatus]|uniref:Uncharacterized protein n=1 Tax=Portunus trituberculatus TaxID=210409 RepID=A0A5B7F2X3_PORTR|nr:hypothetical protein [Portunus trituberculatus]
MQWFSLSLLACLVAVTVAQPYNSSELTLQEKLDFKVPPDTVALPPGVGLCMKGLPRDQCSVQFGGGRGIATTARKNIVKRLEKRGWVKTKKLPRQINAVHICCHKKKFGMELKPKDTKDGKPIKRQPKKLKEDTEKTWKDINKGKNETKKKKHEKAQTSETEKEDGGVKKTHKANATAPQEKEETKPEIKSYERKEKSKEVEKGKRFTKEESVKHKKKEKEVEPGRNITSRKKWKTQTDRDEKPSKESEGKFGEDKVVKPEREEGKEKNKPPKLPPWMTKDLDKKLPEQYLEGEELIDETDLW